MGPLFVYAPVDSCDCAASATDEAKTTFVTSADDTSCWPLTSWPWRVPLTDKVSVILGLVYKVPLVPGGSVPKEKLSVPEAPGATWASVGSCAEVHWIVLLD